MWIEFKVEFKVNQVVGGVGSKHWKPNQLAGIGESSVDGHELPKKREMAICEKTVVLLL